jgi:hypothetical protein
MGHYLMAVQLGVQSFVTFSWTGGFLQYANPGLVTAEQDALIGLAGGLFVAVLFGLLWVSNQFNDRYNPCTLDENFIFAVITITSIFYSTGETFEWWAPTWTAWSTTIGTLTGLAVSGILYGKRIVNWWIGDDNATQ